MSRLEIIGITGLPAVRPGDDLGLLIADHAQLRDGDVVVVAQKVVSKAEGRVVRHTRVTAGSARSSLP